MFCERVLGTLDVDAADGPSIDWLDLTWFDCTQRALRKRTRAGVEIRILLPVGQTPRHHDLLVQDGAATIAINLLPTDVLVGQPATIADMARLAIEIGNLHLPAQVAGDALILLPDGPTEAALKNAGVSWRCETRRFVPERSSVSGVIARASDFTIRRIKPTLVPAPDHAAPRG